ncbi:hypothetical protein Ancab_018657, partial [Ancistrocladus abbreviatus]
LLKLSEIFWKQVIVSTKSPRSDKQHVWEAVADSSSYVIREETDPQKLSAGNTNHIVFEGMTDIC